MRPFASQLELGQPWLLAGLIVLPLLAYYFHRGLVDFPRWQRLLSLACRSAIVAALVLALAGLTLLRPTRETYVVFVLDHSASVGAESRRAAEEFVDRALAGRGRPPAAFLYFAAEPGPLLTRRPDGGGPPLQEQGTDLGAAVEVAAGAVPPSHVPHLVLLTDGNQTAGDALKAVRRAGVPVSTVPLPSRDDPEVQVSAVNVPAQVREGEPFTVEIVLDSNHDDAGVLEVYCGPHLVDRKEPCPVRKGENTFQLKHSLTGERLAIYTAKIRGFRDTTLDNNSASGLVFTNGKPRVLVIDGDANLAKKYLAPALEQEDIRVEVRPPRGMPESLADLQNYELLVLSNVPAREISRQQMEVARTYVQELGGGFLMLGGDQSFGLGGYYKTVLEEILPVRSDFEKEKEKPTLGMVLILDRSGSMQGQKMELAKEAARSAVALLGPGDQVGVIAFDDKFSWVSEMRPGSDKAYVADQISKIYAAGGTIMYPPMEQAYETLKRTNTKLKHVILLTDGIAERADFQGLARRMESARITLSTVAVGNDADRKLLEELARIGKGRSYFTADPSSVPQIFAQETVTASQSAINERPFVPQVVSPTPVLANLDFAAAPELLGHVMTRRKETSEMVLATERGDPLLVWWRFGLGMTVAFTSDAKNKWAADWISSWPDGYSKFWAQVVRHAMRKNDARGVEVKVEQKHRRATVVLDAVDPAGRFLNNAETELTVIDPQLGTRRLPMTQTAPGRYVREFETPDAGAYHLEVSQKFQGKVLHRQSRGLTVGYPEELRLRPTNEGLLRAIADVSGGKYDPEPEAVFAPLDRTARRAEPLWPYLVLAAAVLFVADVALRRIDWGLTLQALRRFRRHFFVVSRKGPG